MRPVRARIVAQAAALFTVAVALLALAGAQPAFALTEITIGPISAVLPDADGFLDGDSDCTIEVRVDGTLVGITPLINGSNIPSWPAVQFSYQYVPPSSPFLVMSFKAYDHDGLSAEYLGEGLIAYNWLAGSPGTFTTSVNSPFGAGYTITASFDANEVAVPVESGSWGGVKALYR